MIKITLNGKKLSVEEGMTIIQVAQQERIDIPTLCYHPLLEPYAACRMCVVEIRGDSKSELKTSCNTKVQEGMVIETDSEMVVNARRLNLELLMARAPAAKVIQELAVQMGIEKTPFPIEDPEEKCILCGMCVRVCEDVVGAYVLTFEERGFERKVTTAFNMPSEKCIECGACAYFCPTEAIKVEDFKGREVLHSELTLGPTTAIRIPFMQSTPNIPFIDKDSCIHFKTEQCKLCEKVCEPEAISHAIEDTFEEIEVGTAILATGYELLDTSNMQQFGYGRYDNVITSLEFEHLCHASGPTGGKILLKDGREPKSVAILHCIGSRDENYKNYCSRVCCMYAMKMAHLVHEKVEAEVYEFYIDIRAFGKGYEEFYNRMQKEGTHFIRGKAAEVTTAALIPEEENKLIVRAEDTTVNMIRRIPVDLVILCPAIVPRKDSEEIAKLFGLCPSPDGFFKEQHPKLAPVSTDADGIFLAGACQSPKDIPDTVAQGAGAAGAVMSLGDEVAIEPIFSEIDDEICVGCKICIGVCPYEAISFLEEKKISSIEETLCKGCGACVAACPSGAADQNCFTNIQIEAEVSGALF